MKRLVWGFGVLVLAAAALIAIGGHGADAASVSPTGELRFTPTQGPVSEAWTAALFFTNADGLTTQIDCTAGTEFVNWDSPSVLFSSFSGTVPTGSFVGVHSKITGGCQPVGSRGIVGGTGQFTVTPSRQTTTSTTTTSTSTTTSTTTTSTTTTTTTTLPPDTVPETPTTEAITPTSRPHRPVTTTTTTTTLPPETTTTTAATTVPLPPPSTEKQNALRLDEPATPPGGDDQAIGEGCDPNHPVTLTIDSQKVGTTTADASGHFTSHVDVPNLPVGEYDVVATCGPVLTTTISLVLPSTLGPPSGTLTVVFFFLLIGFALVRRQIAGDLARKNNRRVEQ